MNDIPVVSIIMATYNRAHFIVETLQSIQDQTFQNWECLIIDDGGNDTTQEVIAELLDKDKRFRFFKRSNKYQKGLSGSRNYGLDLAQGNYIVFFDDDDFVHPENLKISIESIQKNKVDFCHYQKHSYKIHKPEIHKAVVKTEQLLTVNDIAKVVNQQIGIASCTVMWKKGCYKRIRFNENLLYAEEWECYSRLISEGFRGVIIDTVLYYNRKHSKSNTGEFYRNDPIRRASKKEAILLVVQNLKEKQLLTSSLIHYFVQESLSFKEEQLFEQIVSIIQLPYLEKIKWQLFYFSLPLRLFLFGKWKKIKKMYSE